MRRNVVTRETATRPERRVEEERRLRPGGGYRLIIGALLGGLIGGAVFIALQMILPAVIAGSSPWGPPILIGAILMGRDVLPDPGTLPTLPIGVISIGLAFHFGLSILFGLVLATLVERMNLIAAVVAGAGFGVLLYFINFYGFTEIFPWFAMARGWITVLNHALFGLSAALVYVAIRRSRLPRAMA